MDNNILHIAAEFKHIDFFKQIPPQSPLFWTTNNKGETPLHVAAGVGCDEGVEFLINHAKKLRVDDEESEPTTYPMTRGAVLDWGRRLKIIPGVARGLLFLHHDSCLKVIHRDLRARRALGGLGGLGGLGPLGGR
ncbi:ankyrin repeat-containing protein [Prunus yedoensis var. nudiflora]|uniref:Ankyrin repeat-containing protein n=1 Tax=Prunus yedoensis var. nudiflora TaxID=2094558 RepID=A0A314ZM29_PRUYE|nr:ankyrin repeat-containing protein [Prunus yedoensis var. nudiflora]